MIKDQDNIGLTITLEREVMLTGSAATMARLMGVDMETLRGIVEDGADWEPDDATLSLLADAGEIHSEEWDWTEIDVVD